MDEKVQALKRLYNKFSTPDNTQPEEESSLLSKAADYLDRPAAATRSAVYAAQAGENPLTAFGKQLGMPSEQAPTGVDIAERSGFENPYALGALATIADLGLDPLNFIPGSKGGKTALKMADEAGKVGKAIHGAEELKNIRKVEIPKPAPDIVRPDKGFGSVTVKNTEPVRAFDDAMTSVREIKDTAGQRLQKFKERLGLSDSEMDEVLSQFPQADVTSSRFGR